MDADPPEKRGRLYGQGRDPRGIAQLDNQRAPAPVHRGNEHGMQGRRFAASGGGSGLVEGRASNVVSKGGGQSGSRRGPYDRRGRATPAEERALASGVLVTEEGCGDWRKPANTIG